jgi:hypothetical protein
MWVLQALVQALSEGTGPQVCVERVERQRDATLLLQVEDELQEAQRVAAGFVESEIGLERRPVERAQPRPRHRISRALRGDQGWLRLAASPRAAAASASNCRVHLATRRAATIVTSVRAGCI